MGIGPGRVRMRARVLEFPGGQSLQLTKLVAGLPASVPFVGPEAQERARGREFRARIGANESVFGPSPKALKAMQDAAAGCWMYADPENHDLRRSLAALHGTEPGNIVVGEGIDGLLGYLVRMIVEPGARVVTSLGAYPTFNFHVAGYGGDLVTVPYRDDCEDLDGLVAAARESGARLVYVANPDNPMGTFHSAETVEAAIARLPGGCLLVLDEAYIDCAPGRPCDIDTSNASVIRMRTFSKVHGMAGARVGYAIGHERLIGSFNKIRNHFGMCRISQIGALASLGDKAHLENVIGRIEHARRRIAAIAASNGLYALPSAANFVAIDCGRDGAFARMVLEGLIARDVFVRMPFVAPQDRCIRVSAGTDGDLDIFERVLPEALEEASNVSG